MEPAQQGERRTPAAWTTGSSQKEGPESSAGGWVAGLALCDLAGDVSWAHTNADASDHTVFILCPRYLNKAVKITREWNLFLL